MDNLLTSSWPCTAAMLALSAALGCRQGHEIRSYPVPKATAQRVEPAPSTGTGEPTDRMLTVVVPDGQRAWFYKVVGPIAAVDKHAGAVLDFVADTPPPKSAALPEWKLPDGWSQRPGSGQMFAPLATLVIPTEGAPLELTVNTASWDGTQESLLNNVNRWREQMSLKETVAAALPDDVRERKAGDVTLTIVDLRGQFRRGGMGPFARGRSMRGSSPPSVLPADHPPIAATGGAPSAAPPADVPAFEAPAAWQAAPAGGMNRAAFRVAADGREAEVTISNVSNSAGPMFADPLAIANMWRSSVGLPEIAADQFGEVSESIEIGGRAATYVAIIPEPAQADPSRAAQATLGAMVRAGEQVWFFKMKGDRGLVTDMQGEFKTFLKSVRFAADAPETPPQAGGGKNDGND